MKLHAKQLYQFVKIKNHFSEMEFSMSFIVAVEEEILQANRFVYVVKLTI